jgi:hypothetical protein
MIPETLPIARGCSCYFPSLMTRASSDDVRAYYQTALSGLRFVEARRPSGRRFGADADARWAGFRGDLTTADRLDLMLRDADAEWPGAFGARTVFAEPAVANDEAFGPAWPGLEPVDAEEVWRTTLARTEPRDLDSFLAAWSQAWSVPLSPVDVGPLTTVDRLVVAGPLALAAALRAFVGRNDLAWTEQVTIVATPPAHRQLAWFATAALNATKQTTVVTHGQARSLIGRPVVSPDASPDDAAAAGRSTI